MSKAGNLLTPASSFALTDSVVANVGGNPRLVAFNAFGRQKNTGDRTFYVRKDGSDSNDGGANTAGGAFLTIQAAIDRYQKHSDPQGFLTTIQVAAGTYVEQLRVFGRPAGELQYLTIKGNEADPTTVVVRHTASFAATVWAWGWVDVDLRGLQIENLHANGMGVTSQMHAMVGVFNCKLHAAAYQHLYALYHGHLYCSTCTCDAGSQSFLGADTSSIIEVDNITFTGTPAFSYATVWATNLSVVLNPSTWTGAATGKRFVANTNSIIQVYGGGANHIPGNAVGETATGGVYG